MNLTSIAACTGFDKIADTYTCPVCDSGKDIFELLVKDGILNHG